MILRGVKRPAACKLFGTVCTPESPMGSCMVSSEGVCAALHGLVAALLAAVPEGSVHVLRDATRGRLATSLNEICRQSGVGMRLDEAAKPVRPKVDAACELLGLDLLYVANEGKLIAVVAPAAADAAADAALAALRAHPLGAQAAHLLSFAPRDRP